MNDQTTNEEPYITTAEAGRIAPGNPHANVVYRWAVRGLQGASADEIIRLRHLRVGGSIYTKKSWLFEFFEALAQAKATMPTANRIKAPPEKTRAVPPSRRAKQIAESQRRLAAMR